MKIQFSKEYLALLSIPLTGVVAYYCLRKNYQLYLAIEVGGTSTRMAIVKQSLDNPYVIEIVGNRILRTDTRTPEELVNFIKNHFTSKDFSKIAISSFGPLNLKPGSDYGKVTAGSSPQKIPWIQFSLANQLSKMFGKEARIETDVNASALAEHFLCAPEKRSSLAYITIGTGVGVGLVIHNKAVHGFQHPEGGHVLSINKNWYPRR
jgi:fructokinase